METAGHIAESGLRGPGTLLVCYCYQVTEAEVREAIAIHGPGSVKEITELTQAGAGCAACHRRLGRMMRGLPATSGLLEICGRCGVQVLQCRCGAT